jgi:hypothetical protein
MHPRKISLCPTCTGSIVVLQFYKHRVTGRVVLDRLPSRVLYCNWYWCCSPNSCASFLLLYCFDTSLRIFYWIRRWKTPVGLPELPAGTLESTSTLLVAGGSITTLYLVASNFSRVVVPVVLLLPGSEVPDQSFGFFIHVFKWLSSSSNVRCNKILRPVLIVDREMQGFGNWVVTTTNDNKSNNSNKKTRKEHNNREENGCDKGK